MKKASKHDARGTNLRRASFVFLLLVLLCSPTGMHKLFAQGDVSFIATKDFGVGAGPSSITVQWRFEDLATAIILLTCPSF